MSGKLVNAENQPTKVADQLELTMQTFHDVTKKPLRLLPPELRHEAFKVWNMNKLRFGMDTPLTLSAVLAIWITDHGLTVEDAKTILKQSTHPACMMNIKNSHDLVTEMAKLATRAIDARARIKSAEESQRKRQEQEDINQRASPEALDMLREMTKGMQPKPKGTRLTESREAFQKKTDDAIKEFKERFGVIDNAGPNANPVG